MIHYVTAHIPITVAIDPQTGEILYTKVRHPRIDSVRRDDTVLLNPFDDRRLAAITAFHRQQYVTTVIARAKTDSQDAPHQPQASTPAPIA